MNPIQVLLKDLTKAAVRRAFGLFSVLFDSAATFLFVPALAILYWLDPAKLLTLLEWMLFAAVIAGFTIHISRLLFPQIWLSLYLEKARECAIGAAIVAAAVVLCVGMVFIGLTSWVKP